MKRIGSPCEICNTPSKYRCPGCNLLSCSLACTNTHKSRLKCTGKRLITEAPIDDALIASDYRFLEGAGREVDASRRILERICGVGTRMKPQHSRRILEGICGVGRRKKPKHMTQHQFRFAVVTAGMERANKNRTRYCHRTKTIFWTIEWIFHSTSDVVVIDHDVDENTILSNVITEHLKPCPMNHLLRPFCKTQLEDLKFFLKTDGRASKSPFRELTINGPIRPQLMKTVILEYPVIHVHLPSDSYGFEIESWKFRIKNEEPPSADPSSLSLQATLVREEEIEEGEVSPTRYLDLRVDAISAPRSGIHILENVMSTEKAGSSNSQMPEEAGEVSKPSSDDSKAFVVDQGDWLTEISQAVATDIGKQLNEFYSDDIDMNVDDFLTLDGLDDNCGLEETHNSLVFAKQFLLGEEELEEGEVSS